MKVRPTLRGVKKTLMAAAIALSIGQAAADGYNEGFLAAEAGEFKSAVQYWKPLAEQGHAIAQFNLGMMYHGGLGVELDETKALEWYHRSAENGYHKAQEYLAVGYREGWFGLPKDIKRADYWEQRIEQGK